VHTSIYGQRYQVIRKLGEGGMAVVYLALDEKLGRHVAIKVLREKFQEHKDIRARFQHEAKAISSFDHTNILRVFDYSGADSKELWIVTELIHGRNLGQIVETAPGGWLHPILASCIVREIAKALSVAHQAGVVHRDIKPDNVMMTQAGLVKLMDFGIAKIQQKQSMTQTGMFMGSPSYMSAEQVRGRDVDHRSDIYSLGVLFYELCTGKLPFVGQSTADVAMKILEGQFQHPKFIKAHIPSTINDLIVSMMAVDPQNRPQSIESVAGALDQVLMNNGFDASHMELERCFQDPKKYSERLAQLMKSTVVMQDDASTLAMGHRLTHATKLMQDPMARAVQNFNDRAVDHPKPHIPVPRQVSQEPFLTNQVEPKKTAFWQLPNPPPRRDHQLPKRNVPSVNKHAESKNNAVEQTIQLVANLPERRQLTRVIQQQAIAHQQLPAKVIVELTHQKSHSSATTPKQSLPLAQGSHRPIGPRPPRSLIRSPFRPPAPAQRRAKHYVVVHKNAYADRSTSLRGPGILALAVLILGWLYSFERHKTVPQNNRAKPRDKATQITEPKPRIPQKVNPSVEPSSVLPNNDSSASVSRDRGGPLPSTQSRSVDFRYVAPPAGKPKQRVTSKNQESVSPQAAVESNNPKPGKKESAQDDANIKPLPSNISNIKDEKNDFDVGTTQKEPKEPKELKEPTEQKTSLVPIQISSAPAARIYIDNRLRGTTNDAGSKSQPIPLTLGSHRLELKRDGYKTQTQILNVSNDTSKIMGPYTLSKDDSGPESSSPSTSGSGPSNASSEVRNYTIVVSSNVYPCDVIVVNFDSKQTTTLSLMGKPQAIQLPKGVYDVTVDNRQDVIRRRIDLTKDTRQFQFNAQFKQKNSGKSSSSTNGGTAP
jgi:serine/threonine protein kinase